MVGIDVLAIGIGAGALGVGLGSFAQGVGSRLAGRFFPSDLERAQITSLAEQLALTNKQIVLQERRLDEERERVLLEIRKRFELQEHFRRLEMWPLVAYPGEIIEFSQGRQCLNLIVLRRWDKGVTDQSQLIFHNATDELLSRFDNHFRGFPLATYSDFNATYNTGAARPIASGQTLTAQLWGFLRSEPCILIEVTSRADDGLRLSGTIWGYGETPERTGRLDIDLRQLKLEERNVAVTTLLRGFTAFLLDVLLYARKPTGGMLPSVDAWAGDAALSGDGATQFASVYLPILNALSERATALGIVHLLEASTYLAKARQIEVAKDFFAAASNHAARLAGCSPPETWNDLAFLTTLRGVDASFVRQLFHTTAKLIPGIDCPSFPDYVPLLDTTNPLVTIARRMHANFAL